MAFLCEGEVARADARCGVLTVFGFYESRPEKAWLASPNAEPLPNQRSVIALMRSMESRMMRVLRS